MKRGWIASCFSIPLAFSLAALSFAQSPSQASVLDEVLQVERKIWTALQTRRLDDALAHLDATYTAFESEVGKRFDSAEEHRSHTLQTLEDVTIDAWEILDPRIQQYGNTVVLTYLGHDSGTDEGKAYDHVWKVTAVYVKRDGAWKIVHYHWSLDSEQ